MPVALRYLHRSLTLTLFFLDLYLFNINSQQALIATECGVFLQLPLLPTNLHEHISEKQNATGLAFCQWRRCQNILKEPAPVAVSQYWRRKGLCWLKSKKSAFFDVADPGLFLAFLLKSNFVKLLLWHSIYLIASHLLAQFISTGFANKIQFLLLATLQSLHSYGKIGCTQFLLMLHQSKRELMQRQWLCCQQRGGTEQPAAGCPSDPLHNL